MRVQHPKSLLDFFASIDAEVMNFRRAVVKINRGHYYIERALIKIHEDGTLSCANKEFLPSPEVAEQIKKDLEGIEFPKSVKAYSLDGLTPKLNGPYFTFVDQSDGGIIMVQERIDEENKRYISWTQMDNGEWIAMEPDGPLPFWKPAKPMNGARKIMIHEGAKAADYVTRLVAEGKDHPWIETLAQYEHWGMIGGALVPHRANYEEIRKAKPREIVYACDHDRPGESALQKVSKCMGKSMKGLVFGKAFPPSWDMADPLPGQLFSPTGRYLGEPLPKLLVPATWATEKVPNPEGKGKDIVVIRSEFAEEWMHCVTPEVFVHVDWPHNLLTTSEFDNKVKPFSHVDQTGRLLKNDFGSKASVIKYIPGLDTGIYSGCDQDRYINTYCPPSIKGDPKIDVKPFLEFLADLCPDPEDRHEVMRWCATLIARPDVKMKYALLMISEMQGVGKGTLGEKILIPLVGHQNCSVPTEKEIVESNYNYWLAHKRLAVVHEIYAGNSSKAYDNLKSVITDRYCTVSKKYQANYQVESWVHIFACSNSMRALKIAIDDRRWFIPKVSEKQKTTAYWDGFIKWLEQEGGLSGIKAWAEGFVQDPANVVAPGARAPDSKTKRMVVEEGYSPGQQLVHRTLINIAEQIKEGKMPATTFLLDTDLQGLIRDVVHGGQHHDKLERTSTIRTVAKALGWTVGEEAAYVRTWGTAAFGARLISLDPATAEASPAQLAKNSAPLDPKSIVGL